MKKISIIYLFAVIFSIVFSSCTSTEEEEAIVLDIQKMREDYISGYDWFSFEYEDYTIKSAYLEDLKNNYDNSIHSFLIYSKPSCSCGPEYRKTAQFIKVLDSIGVETNNIQLYSVGNNNYSHPYKDKITLNNIPAFIVLKNNVPVYSINDTIIQYNNARFIEDCLLDALKK